jgi:hypothetical protein
MGMTSSATSYCAPQFGQISRILGSLYARHAASSRSFVNHYLPNGKRKANEMRLLPMSKH